MPCRGGEKKNEISATEEAALEDRHSEADQFIYRAAGTHRGKYSSQDWEFKYIFWQVFVSSRPSFDKAANVESSKISTCIEIVCLLCMCVRRYQFYSHNRSSQLHLPLISRRRYTTALCCQGWWRCVNEQLWLPHTDRGYQSEAETPPTLQATAAQWLPEVFRPRSLGKAAVYQAASQVVANQPQRVLWRQVREG